MRNLVLDASAALHLVLRVDGYDALIGPLEEATQVVAPHLYLSETANALWKYVQRGHFEEQEALERFDEVRDLVVHPMEDGDLASEALSMAIKYGHPVYDAMYAVLARRLSYPLMTRDRRLRDLLERLRIDSI